MHVTSGFCPRKGAKHNLWQGQRGQAEVKERQESFRAKQEAGKGVGEVEGLPGDLEDQQDLDKEGS
jgi:hypothetical protein